MAISQKTVDKHILRLKHSLKICWGRGILGGGPWTFSNGIKPAKSQPIASVYLLSSGKFARKNAKHPNHHYFPECTKIARLSAAAAAILTAPQKSRDFFEAPRCAMSSAKKIASEPRFLLRRKWVNMVLVANFLRHPRLAVKIASERRCTIWCTQLLPNASSAIHLQFVLSHEEREILPVLLPFVTQCEAHLYRKRLPSVSQVPMLLWKYPWGQNYYITQLCSFFN